MRRSLRLLLVDADPIAQRTLLLALHARGHQAEALTSLARLQHPGSLPGADLLLLACPRNSTTGTPDALALLRGLRLVSGLPVIVLCDSDDAADRVLALHSGADDCLTRPLVLGELLARIEAVLRRVRAEACGEPQAQPAASAGHPLSAGAWQLDPLSRTLRRAQGPELPLTDGEFRLMRAFFQRPRHVLQRADLLALAGDDARADAGADPGSRGVDLLVSRLRGKLGDSARRPRWIQTVRGQGYRFNLPDA